MNTTLISGGIVAFGALVGGALGLDGAKTLSSPKPEGMMVADVYASGGLVYQSHVVLNGNQPATWAARIEKDGVACEGSSKGAQASYQSNYDSPPSFTSKEWTGDQSCNINPDEADKLWAQWQYVTENGLKLTLTAER